MAPDAREPRLLHVLTDARGRDFAALDDALGEAGDEQAREGREPQREHEPFEPGRARPGIGLLRHAIQ